MRECFCQAGQMDLPCISEKPEYIYSSSAQETVCTTYDIAQSSTQTAAHVCIQSADCPVAEAR
jgi:hypothetical protein